MLRKRTQAQRDAINARAAALPRPLSLAQRRALASMMQGPLKLGVFLSATVDSLVHRRLCKIEGKQRPRAVITAAGRRELARHRGGSDAS